MRTTEKARLVVIRRNKKIKYFLFTSLTFAFDIKFYSKGSDVRRTEKARLVVIRRNKK